MKSYELMTITKGQLSDDQATQAREAVTKAISAAGGSLKNSQNLGRKKFAYPIHTETEGYYDVFNFDMDEVKVSELKSKLNYMDTTVRYLLTLAASTKAVEQETNVSTQSE